ncbi:MAG: hypothetical protein NTZ59_12270, partial [Bacteroidetes bacterium]|nr:hypothetical protein [Bacteroidota bacterium]
TTTTLHILDTLIQEKNNGNNVDYAFTTLIAPYINYFGTENNIYTIKDLFVTHNKRHLDTVSTLTCVPAWIAAHKKATSKK